jgi:hypothetical protein
MIVEATGSAGAMSTFAAGATDTVDGTIAVSCSPASGSTFPLGSTTVACSAQDAHGNTASGSFRVLVRDSTAPQLTLPADIVTAPISSAGAVVNYTASAIDAVDGPVPVNCSAASGSLLPLGNTAVNCSATDAHGNAATGSFHVTVQISWSNLLPPIDVNGGSVFKAGSTVPVKFRLTGASAGIATLIARIEVAQVSDGITGTYLEPTSTSAADVGNTFRYDASSNIYIFNFGTKGYNPGTWAIRVDLGDGLNHVTIISLKK